MATYFVFFTRNSPLHLPKKRSYLTHLLKYEPQFHNRTQVITYYGSFRSTTLSTQYKKKRLNNSSRFVFYFPKTSRTFLAIRVRYVASRASATKNNSSGTEALEVPKSSQIYRA